MFHTPTNDGDTPGDLDVPGGGPPDDNDPDFDDPLPDSDPKDDDKAYRNEEQPQDPLVQLAQVVTVPLQGLHISMDLVNFSLFILSYHFRL